MRNLRIRGEGERGVPVRSLGVLLAAGALAAAGCGSQSGESSAAATTTPPAATSEAKPGASPAVPPEVVAKGQFKSPDGCAWSVSNPQPFFNVAKKLIIVDSRCTEPANDPVGIYPGPKQVKGKYIDRRTNGDVVPADCLLGGGEYVQNSNAVGTDGWIRLVGGGMVPNTHTGFIPETGSPEARYAQPGNTLNACE